MPATAVVHSAVPPITSFRSSLKRVRPHLRRDRSCLRFQFCFSQKKLRPLACKKQLSEIETQDPENEDFGLFKKGVGGVDLGWLPSLPHIVLASMSNFLFGYHIGVMNGPIVSIARELGFEGNSFLEGLVVSMFNASALIGSIGAASLIDNLGCRRTIQIVSIPLILGAVLSGQAHSIDEILLGRFLVGLGLGVTTALVPLYISEVAPTKYRGSLGGLCQVGTCSGIIASLLLAIPSDTDPHWWRNMLYIAGVPGLILIVGMQFAVESPRWLCKVGRWNDARTIVSNLWGEGEVEKSIEEFQSVIRTDGSDLEGGWLELLKEPHSRVAFIGGMLFLLQQFAGVNGVFFFSSLTFRDVGITNSALASLFVGLTNMAGAFVASYLIEKEGRQKLLIASYVGMATSMLLVVYAISAPVDPQLHDNLSIIGTLAYIFAFSTGAGPVTGIIISELSSNKTRGKIMSFSFSVHWVCNFVVTLFFLQLVDEFGIAPVYSAFAGVCLMAALFGKYFTVETKGRSLEEIEMSLNPNFSTRGK